MDSQLNDINEQLRIYEYIYPNIITLWIGYFKNLNKNSNNLNKDIEQCYSMLDHITSIDFKDFTHKQIALLVVLGNNTFD